MTNTPHPSLLLLLLLPLLLILCSLLAVSGRSQLAKDPATFQNTGDSYDYTNEEYEEVSNRAELTEMEEMEQNAGTKLQSQYSPSKHKRQRRQVGERDSPEESSGDTEPILMEDPQGWGLAHILGQLSLSFSLLKSHTAFTPCLTSCRNCLSGLPSHLHHWHHLQTHQDASGNLRERRSRLPQIQIRNTHSSLITEVTLSARETRQSGLRKGQ